VISKTSFSKQIEERGIVHKYWPKKTLPHTLYGYKSMIDNLFTQIISYNRRNIGLIDKKSSSTFFLKK